MDIKRKELETIRRQLRAAIEIIDAHLEPLVIPEDVQKEVDRKLAARICLAWDHDIPEGEQVMRGLCETDYHTTMARVRRGTDSERDLMLKGQLGPPAKPGRKAARDIAADKSAKALGKSIAAKAKQQRKKKGSE